MLATLTADARKRKVVAWGINFLSWISPFIGFGIFFPLGVLFAFPYHKEIRRTAFSSIVLQIAIASILYPLEFLLLFSPEAEQIFNALVLLTPEEPKFYGVGVLTFLFISGLIILLLQARFVRNRLRPGEGNPPITNSILVFIALICLILFTGYFTYDDIFRTKMATFLVFSESLWIFFPWTIALAGMMSARRPVFIFRRPWAWFVRQSKDARAIETEDSPSSKRKRRNSKVRDAILPGWGHIYNGNLWRGFPILFVFLLLLLLFSTFFFSFLEPAFGIRFLAALGLKPGISDKQFFAWASTPWPWLVALVLFVSVGFFSGWLLRRSFHAKLPATGLRPGFANNLALSVLVHLVILCLILIIPTMMSRQKQEEKGRPNSHYTPENQVEYWFIDPNLPEETEGLNGGVITGTDTPNSEMGERLPNEKPAEEGRVKGEVKRIKGKKLPPTYSNYISAKMRTYESFMDYWRSAPQNYSCVVAYTITPEGEVVDVQLVEHSVYPEQDRRTLELIENLSPMMPPPNMKGYIRVTELFWNGAINPDAMPTELQKELVNMYDGRYMEEL
ncbi:energy transducer TonB [Leptospira langatensis]|uniref:Energy transducer TonB n=1 Tax=Leptospira langatensis TaxID=2484983 RepID=A0A5F1ZYD4_9LEPT|nr:energy transducer TonB [Leptospira langatensis]TGJ98634.1 energy transducer TonB [Leptospira langatensis]TGL43796.1 energy transducer TonB [Leptospira langatensis]